MDLILDIGNTRTKYAIFKDCVLVSKGYCSDNELENGLIPIQGKVDRLLLSSVKPLDIAQEKVFEKICSNVHVLCSKLKMPFHNGYETPETVGADRLALAAGGLLCFPKNDILIIDIGTCITFDFVSKEGVYLGGAISPGLQMRLKALHQFTGKLPLVAVKEPIDLIGRNTNDSILSGVIHGMNSEIEGIIDAYKLRYSLVKTIITGGDAAYFDKKLKNSIFADANILLKGMHFILEHNSDENK
jgi:type III pantothenate kinase